MAKYAAPFAAVFLAAILSFAAPSLADDKPPVPMPDDAAEVAYDGDAGTLAYSSTKPVKAGAEFYRALAKKNGWKEIPSVINKDNMSVLTFVVGDNDVGFTIMALGDKTQVEAQGTILESKGSTGEQAKAWKQFLQMGGRISIAWAAAQHGPKPEQD